MRLTLVLPNLLDFPPSALAVDDAPALSRLLSSAKAPLPESGGRIAVACASLGIARQLDWPAAPWLARAAGIDVGARYWLCADPVTLELGRGEGRLAGIVHDLDAGDRAALLSSLRSHFASDGIEFVASASGRWWMGLDAAQAIETSPPDAAFDQPLAAHLPRGADAARWRRWQSEIQMLLFEHPVNQSREKNGLAPINYLWTWGGGTLRPSEAAAPASAPSSPSVFAGTPWLRDLARAAGASVEAAPRSLAALRVGAATSALVWLDDFEPPALREQIAAFDDGWVAPLQQAVDKRELDLRLVIAGAATALSFATLPSSALQRIRRRWSPPAQLAAQLALPRPA
jgi:hypothetical protein